jgi:polyisoprenoid-binding protein YceI
MEFILAFNDGCVDFFPGRTLAEIQTIGWKTISRISVALLSDSISMKFLRSLLLIFAFLLAGRVSAQSVWKIDNAHSNVNFAIQWREFSFRTGEFKKFEGEIKKKTEDSFEGAEIVFSADANSVDLIAEQLAQLAQTPEFLDAPQFPKITFVSKEVKLVSGKTYEVLGELTIKGKSQSVKLQLEDNGTSPGNNKTYGAIKVTGNLNKSEFAITGGGARLGNLIVLTCYFETIKK